MVGKEEEYKKTKEELKKDNDRMWLAASFIASKEKTIEGLNKMETSDLFKRIRPEEFKLVSIKSRY